MTHIPDPPAEPDTPPLNRTISPIAQRLTYRPPRSLLIIALGLLGGAGVLLAGQPARAPESKAHALGPAKQVVRFEPSPRRPTLAEPGPDAPSLWEAETVDPDTDVTTQPDPSEVSASGPTPGAETKASRPSGPLVVYSRSIGSQSQNSPGPGPTLENAPIVVRTASGDDRRGQDAIATVKADHVGDRNYLVLAGAVLPCLLQTALDSSRPGYATCLLPSDVYSDNGATIVLEKGTRVLGRYDASLARGDERLLVRWMRAVTPAGVTIWLDAPAADALGRSGLAGELDTRFWSRFGGAVLLSLVDQAHTSSRPPDRQVWVTPSQAPTVALETSINLPPRLVAPQGLEVSIFVTQDLDFSEVYELKRR